VPPAKRRPLRGRLDPKSTPAVGASAFFAVTGLVYSSIWSLNVSAHALEVAAAGMSLGGALLVVRELFERTRAAEGADQSRHLMTAAIWLAGGFLLM
jgi:hypothetical protein